MFIPNELLLNQLSKGHFKITESCSSPTTGPISVTIDITRRCNVQCKICYLFSPTLEKPQYRYVRSMEAGVSAENQPGAINKGNRRYEDFSFTEFAKIVRELRKQGVCLINISGEGEPLLHPRLFDMIACIKSEDLECGIVTNGTCLNKKVADTLVKSGLDYLNISILAADAIRYGEIRSPGNRETFNQIKEMISYLSAYKNTNKIKRPLVSLLSVICSLTYDQITQFVELADRTGADYVHFQFLGLHTAVEPLLLDQSKVASLEKEIIEAQALSRRKGIETNLQSMSLIAGKLVGDMKGCTKEIYYNNPCYMGWVFCRILLDGSILPCCSCHTSLGNIFGNYFNEIWESKSYQDFREEGLRICTTRKTLSYCSCFECGHYETNVTISEMLMQEKQRAR